MARRRRQGGGHRGGLRGAGRGDRGGAVAPVRRALVDPRVRGRGGDERGVHVRLAARDRADLQRLRRAAGGRAAVRGARAGRARRRGRGGGLPRRREPPHHRRERLRQRARAHEARRALRQPDRGLHARRGALGRRARAGARQARRRPARDPLPRADHAPRDARSCSGWRSGWRRGRAGPTSSRHSRSRWRSSLSPDRSLAATCRAGSRRVRTPSRCG